MIANLKQLLLPSVFENLLNGEMKRNVSSTQKTVNNAGGTMG